MQKLLDELIDQQKLKLMKMAQKYIPNFTEDDMLQPNDYPVLENSVHFRYEEGILEGLMTAKTALLCAARQATVESAPSL